MKYTIIKPGKTDTKIVVECPHCKASLDRHVDFSNLVGSTLETQCGICQCEFKIEFEENDIIKKVV